MNVLHYSFSLSACPKCHLLICKHTSLANLNFNINQQQIQCSTTTISIENNSSEQHLSNGTNIYIFPPTILDDGYSWTTFGTDTNVSTNTIHNLSLNNQTICENIPFANENILQSSLTLTSKLNNQQSDDNSNNNSQKSISLTKSLSYSSMNDKFSSFSYLKSIESPLTKSYPYSILSLLFIFLLLLTFLITNTFDIVLIYIYYHTNYIYFIIFISIIILCDVILWINNLIESYSMPFYFLLIPFSIRFYLLYQILELLIIFYERNRNKQIFNSLYQIKKCKLYHNLILFYLIHTGFLIFINLYIWSNNFQFSNKFFLNMDYFLPHWIIQTNSTTHLLSLKLQPSEPIPASSIFVLISIFYYLIINYLFLSTYLIYKNLSLLIILSKLCLIIPRIYTFIFLFHLNAWWLSISLVIVHFILMITLVFERTQRNTSFLQIIFSLIIHSSIDDISINALIFLENISIYLHRIYLEIFSYYHYQTTLRLIIFISILISLQIIGFILRILSKYILYSKKIMTKKCII